MKMSSVVHMKHSNFVILMHNIHLVIKGSFMRNSTGKYVCLACIQIKNKISDKYMPY